VSQEMCRRKSAPAEAYAIAVPARDRAAMRTAVAAAPLCGAQILSSTRRR
jgi:hypothetical protein